MDIIGVILGLILISCLFSLYAWTIYRFIKEKLWGGVLMVTLPIWIYTFFWSLDCVLKYFNI